MPHTCTRCNNVFGSGEDILKGCPVCGWKKFMFVRMRPAETKRETHQQDQIITKAMGVRVPPKRAIKEENGIGMRTILRRTFHHLSEFQSRFQRQSLMLRRM